MSANDEYNDKGLDILREVYSNTAISHFKHPPNLATIRNADIQAELTGPCGDTMEISLKVSVDVITEISFKTDGCNNSIASGSMITELAKGKSLNEALRINQQDVLNALGKFPKEGEHCALLAIKTLAKAIENYKESHVD